MTFVHKFDPEFSRSIVRDYVAAFNEGNESALRGLFTPDATIYGVLGTGPFDTVLPIWRELWNGLQMKLIIEEIITEGDVVAVRFSERGRFVAPFRGIEPTGKTYEMTAMEWFHLRDGRIFQRWAARDSGTIARQLGVKLA